MPNPRNLNFVLGSVGASLVGLATQWGTDIPPIQALVINQHDQMPGLGFVRSLVDPQILADVNSRTRKQIVDGMLAQVYAFPRWRDVLREFRLAPLSSVVSAKQLDDARAFRGSGGEAAAHLELKNYVARNPKAVGISQQPLRTVVEYRVPSGDEVDVVFNMRRKLIAVEVKAAIAPEADLIRGVFQCVKYEALLNAEAAATGSGVDVEVILALGGPLPSTIHQLANILGVRVVANVAPALVV
jgi:hypothetical protein